MKEFIFPLLVALIALAATIAATKWKRIRGWWKARDLTPAEGTHFTILVASLRDDTDDKCRNEIIHALDGQPGIRVLQFPKVILVDDAGDRTLAIAKAEENARDELSRLNADVLIWGEVGANGNPRSR